MASTSAPPTVIDPGVTTDRPIQFGSSAAAVLKVLADNHALAQQLALKGAIIDPAPPWLVALTGAAAMAGVAQEAGRLFGRFVPDSVKATVRNQWSQIKDGGKSLGFK